MKLPRIELRTAILTLAIALPLCWVAYQLNWIRERHTFIAKYGATRAYFASNVPTHFPWQLRLFGEHQSTALNVPLDQIERARELFPEVEDMNFYWSKELEAAR